ncbi:MAG: NADH-quinone oxidoreductase subunit NuoG, partial [Gammaproteobacteria bacterium]
LQARKGAMIIEVADQADIAIPRFCYHKKLSIAANCRMCLVEVEKAPKPMPACATPVMEGMKVFTRSERAMSSQRAVMEFLLINHPLDCPICDQGGECELQDLALGYGGSVSRFTEKKRVVEDKNIGPLIATDMTRCIHCTRCIRFLEQIAGQKELGATGRGENMKIGTYIERSIESEMSGNIIDICPVGALTSKPFRFKARAWELTRQPGVAPHDSMGSNIHLHSLRGTVMRVVPRENEEINEVWISDRDRFSYQGLYSDDRLHKPMQKVDGEWREVDWQEALNAVVQGLRGIVDSSGAEQLGLLVSPTATLEEMYLLQRLAEGLGCANIDHRLRQRDFSDQDRAPVFPWLGQEIQALEALDAALIVGSNLRKDAPIAAHRLRKSHNKGGRIMFLNPVDFDFHCDVAHKLIVRPSELVEQLGLVAKAVLDARNDSIPKQLVDLLTGAEPTQKHHDIAQNLIQAERATVMVGNIAVAHPAFSTLRALCALIAEHAGATFGYLAEAANSAGGWLAGALPHRGPGASQKTKSGLTAWEMLASPRQGYVLLGLEPEYDCWDGAMARQAMDRAGFVVSITPYITDAVKQYANVVLPLASFAETSGTFINGEGRWQSFAGASTPLGDARPGWKILRVLGNLLDCSDFNYQSSAQVRDELREKIGPCAPDNRVESGVINGSESSAGMERLGDVPIYAVDSLVRRAEALQETTDGRDASVRICGTEVERLGLGACSQVLVRQGQCSASLSLEVDERVPKGCAWIPASCPSTVGLGPSFGPLELEKG